MQKDLCGFDPDHTYLDMSQSEIYLNNGAFILNRNDGTVFAVCEMIYHFFSVPSLILCNVELSKSNEILKQLKNRRILIHPSNQTAIIDLEIFSTDICEIILPNKCNHVILSPETKSLKLVITNRDETILDFMKSNGAEINIMCYNPEKLRINSKNTNYKIRRVDKMESYELTDKLLRYQFIEKVLNSDINSYVSYDYDVTRLIDGKKNYFDIFEIVDSKNCSFCLKTHKDGFNQNNLMKRFQRDLDLLKYARHQCVIDVIGYDDKLTNIKDRKMTYIQTDCRTKIFFKYQKCELLSNCIEANMFENKYSEISKVLLGICLVMRNMEKLGIIKVDLYPEHILIDEEFNPYICDLSYACCNKLEYDYDGIVKNDDYLPNENLSISTAVYSLGVILYMMMFNQLPYRDATGYTTRLLTNKNSSQITRYLLDSCFEPNPSKRTTFDKIIDDLIRNKLHQSVDLRYVKESYEHVLIQREEEMKNTLNDSIAVMSIIEPKTKLDTKKSFESEQSNNEPGQIEPGFAIQYPTIDF